MANNPLGGIGGGGAGGLDALKEALGIGSPRNTQATAIDSASGNGTPGTSRGPFGPRGQRMLPADFPEERLDHTAPRGTYLDILI